MRLSPTFNLIVLAALCVVPAAAMAQDGGEALRPAALSAVDLELEADVPPQPVAPSTVTRSPGGAATVRAVRVDGLVVDGVLDEAVYETVPPIDGFIQVEPITGELATEQTEVWVLFDDANVYIAVRAWNSAPESSWVVNEMRRDSLNINQNESFGFIFDTFYDRRNGVVFGINPLGGRTDGELGNETAYNADWNPVWSVRPGRFNGGWTVEAAIPFKSLRYRPGPHQVWGLQLRRTARHKNEESLLTRVNPGIPSPFFRVSRSATLVGIEVPDGGRLLEIKPYAVGDLTSDTNTIPMVSNALGGSVGLDLVRFRITENLTTEFTVNTDFAQVEADEQQVNLTRFSLFFPEKREFFLENEGVFRFASTGTFAGGGNTPVIFYSRRIGLSDGQAVPIAVGGRLSGRVGPFTLGLLNIQTRESTTGDAERTSFSVARIRRDVLRRSSIGAIFTNRSVLEGRAGTNQAYGVDATLAFYDTLSFDGYWAKSRTTGRRGRDTSYQAGFRYNGDRYGASIERLFVDTRFAPEIGFVRRRDFRRSSGSLRFSPRPQSIASVRKFSWEASYNYITDAAGMVETREAGAEFRTQFESSDFLTVSYSQIYDFLKNPFRIASGVVIPVGGYDLREARVLVGLGQQRRLNGTVFAEHSTFYEGTKTTLGFGGGGRYGPRAKLTRQWSLEPGVQVNWVDLPQRRFTARLVTTRVTYTTTPQMFISALVQYNSSNSALSSNVRLRWEYQPGSELFIVYNDERDTMAPTFSDLKNRALIIKVNRLFRF